jgi:hypothetical protein
MCLFAIIEDEGPAFCQIFIVPLTATGCARTMLIRNAGVGLGVVVWPGTVPLVLAPLARLFAISIPTAHDFAEVELGSGDLPADVSAIELADSLLASEPTPESASALVPEASDAICDCQLDRKLAEAGSEDKEYKWELPAAVIGQLRALAMTPARI